MNSWKPDWALRSLLAWTGITGLFAWLPLVRCLMDGESYQWGGIYWGLRFHGAGLAGDFWMLPLSATFVLTTLYLGWRGGRRPFHVLLLAWIAPSSVRGLYAALSRPQDFRFRGATLGIDFSLAWIGPVLFEGLLLLAGYWVGRELRADRAAEIAPWGPRNTKLLSIALAPLPLQFYLLRYGPPHDNTDAVGVLLTIAQWLLINIAFARRGT